jgi:hypothetical protein
MTYELTVADKVWNRSCAGELLFDLGPGDRALSAMILVSSLLNNGGVHHAYENLEPNEWAVSIEGYRYFGFNEIADWFEGAASDPLLREWTEETEEAANRRYDELMPGDKEMVKRFELMFLEHPDRFAPLSESQAALD